MVSKCPCKGCEKRYPGCHSKCSGYISWRAELDKRNAEIRAEKEAETSYWNGFLETQKRMKRRPR